MPTKHKSTVANETVHDSAELLTASASRDVLMWGLSMTTLSKRRIPCKDCLLVSPSKYIRPQSNGSRTVGYQQATAGPMNPTKTKNLKLSPKARRLLAIYIVDSNLLQG